MTSFCKISFFGFASNKKHWLNTLLLMEAQLLTLGVQPFCGRQKHLTLKKLNNVVSTIGIQIPDRRTPEYQEHQFIGLFVSDIQMPLMNWISDYLVWYSGHQYLMFSQGHLNTWHMPITRVADWSVIQTCRYLLKSHWNVSAIK